MQLANNKKRDDWRYFEELVEVVQKVSKNKKLLKHFLIDLFTARELKEISKRWQIVKMLKKQVPHQRIAQELHIGVGTVTRGSREMSNPRGGFQLALNKIKI